MLNELMSDYKENDIKLLALERRRNTAKLKDIYYTLINNTKNETKSERNAVLDQLAKKWKTDRGNIKCSINVLISLDLITIDQSCMNHV